MILIDIITPVGNEHVWGGFVPCVPPAGLIISIQYPPPDDKSGPVVRNFRVEGAGMSINSESGYAPGGIRIYARDLAASNIITPGTIQ